MMFGNKSTPDENSFFELETPYQRLVVRQADAMGLHVYQVMSGRAMLDFSTMVAFLGQDPRVVGDEQKRVDSLHHNASSQMMQLHSHVEEGIDDMRDLEPILNALNERDKRRTEP